MDNGNRLNMKIAFQVLSLVFILTTISMIMIFSNFEQGVRDFWDTNKELTTVLGKSDNDVGYVDLDSVDKKEILAEEYIKNGGDVDVFYEIFKDFIEEVE